MEIRWLGRPRNSSITSLSNWKIFFQTWRIKTYTVHCTYLNGEKILESVHRVQSKTAGIKQGKWDFISLRKPLIKQQTKIEGVQQNPDRREQKNLANLPDATKDRDFMNVERNNSAAKMLVPDSNAYFNEYHLKLVELNFRSGQNMTYGLHGSKYLQIMYSRGKYGNWWTW